MNKREAKQIAYDLAWKFIHASICAGSWAYDVDNKTPWSDAEIELIQVGLAEIAQSLFNRHQQMQSNNKPRLPLSS